MDSRGKRRRATKSTDATQKEHETDLALFDHVIHTKVEQLRVPGNTVFIAERTDKIIDVFKGLIKYNFLSVPVIQKTGRKYYGFLDMGDIVGYISEAFGAEKLGDNQDFWKLIEKEEALRDKTVQDVMRFPLTRRNPFHPIKGGYSLFSAMEVLARESGLHCIAIVDDDRNLLNIVTQSQVLRFLVENLDSMGGIADKPVREMKGALKEVFKVNQKDKAIEAFKLMSTKGVSGLAVVNDEGKLVDNVSLRDLKAMAPDAGLFWRLFGTTQAFLDKLDKEHAGTRPKTVQVCSPNDTLRDIMLRLVDNKIHRIFVTDEHQAPVGVISLKDVLLEIITN